MQDAVLVAEGDAVEELVHERLDDLWFELPAIPVRVHELLEVLVHVLEDEHELVLGVNHVVEADNVLVLELLHKRDFADRSAGCALFAVEVDFFEGDEVAGLAVAAFEYLGLEESGSCAFLLIMLPPNIPSHMCPLLASPAAGSYWGGACPWLLSCVLHQASAR